VDGKPLYARLLLRNVERSKAHCRFDAGQILALFVIADFIDRLLLRWCGSAIAALTIGQLFGYRPVGVIQRFEEVFKKVLKEVDVSGELHIDVAVILEDKPWNVGHDEGIFKMTMVMFK
jgi:hypothetical protein